MQAVFLFLGTSRSSGDRKSPTNIIKLRSSPENSHLYRFATALTLANKKPTHLLSSERLGPCQVLCSSPLFNLDLNLHDELFPVAQTRHPKLGDAPCPGPTALWLKKAQNRCSLSHSMLPDQWPTQCYHSLFTNP